MRDTKNGGSRAKLRNKIKIPSRNINNKLTTSSQYQLCTKTKQNLLVIYVNCFILFQSKPINWRPKNRKIKKQFAIR